MLTRLVAVFAGLVSLASVASAYDRGGPRPALWQGFYVGANAGAVYSEVRSHFGGGSFFDKGTDGAYGVHAGYNLQVDQAVVGIEGDWAFVDGGGDLPSLRARLGYAFGPLLAYGTVGVAWAKIDNTFNTGTTSTTFNGIVCGGGLEWMATKNISLRGEVLYTDLGKELITSPLGNTLEQHPEMLTYRLGLTYHFN